MVEAQLDIIVLAHGHLDLTMRCVKSLYQHTTAPFHLIVMDDSTPNMDEGTDLTPEWCERFAKAHDNVTFIHSNEPYKSSLGLFPHAFEHCKTPFVAVVVNSMVVEPEWDTAGLQLLRTVPDAGVIGFKCLRLGTEMIESAGLAISGDGSTLWDIGKGQIGHRLSKVYECDAVQWAFVLLRLEAVKSNLGEDIYHGWKGWEEFETCFAMRANGWKIFYCGLGVGYHQTLATRVAKTAEDLYANFQNREIFAKRWGFWERYHKVNLKLGEFLPDFKAREMIVNPVLVVDSLGVVHQGLDLKEAIRPQEEDAISSLAGRVVRDATFVEVGSWKGHSASIIGKMVKQSGGHLYCVDHWQGNDGTWNIAEAHDRDIYKIFEHNLKALGLWDCITPMKMDSLEASKQFADGSIDFLFLDADHRYEQFKADLEAWLPKVKVGGIICGHDSERYWQNFSESEQRQINDNLSVDYINDIQVHPGVVKALYELWGDDFGIEKDTRVWFKEVMGMQESKERRVEENAVRI